MVFYSRWQAQIVDEDGAIQPSATITVYRENDGALATLKANRDGTSSKTNSFNADSEGFAFFYAAAGRYKIVATSGALTREWRDVPLGTAAEADLDSLTGGLISYLYFDKQVNDQTGLLSWDDQAAGFRVLVSNVSGSGRAALYTLVTPGSPGTWTDPAYLTPSGLVSADIGVTVQAHDADTAKLDIKQTWTKPQKSDPFALTHNTAWDGDAYQALTATINGANFTVANPSPVPAAGFYVTLTIVWTTTHALAFGNLFKGLNTVVWPNLAGKEAHVTFRSDGTYMKAVGFALDIAAS